MNDNNNSQPQQQRPDIAAIIGNQYSSLEFKAEFKAKFREGWVSMPLMVCIVVTIKVSLYITSFFVSYLNEAISLNADKTLFSFQLWRLFTSPLATDSLFDVLLLMPFYIAKSLYPREHLQGTAPALIDFMVKSFCYTLIFSLFATIFGPSGYFICGIFPLNIIDFCTSLLKEQEKIVDLCLVKVNQRNFALIIVGFIWIFMGHPFASVVAMSICAYFDPTGRIGIERIKEIASKLDKIMTSARAVSMEQAAANEKMNTDNLKPFNRNEIRGRVSRQSKSSGSSTRPSSSASYTSTSSGVSLGGDKGRNESNLLNISGYRGSENGQSDHQLITLNSHASEEDQV